MEDINPETLRMRRKEIIKIKLNNFWTKIIEFINSKIVERNLNLHQNLIISLYGLILDLFENFEKKDNQELTPALNDFEEKLLKYYSSRDFSINRFNNQEDKLTFTYLIEW